MFTCTRSLRWSMRGRSQVFLAVILFSLASFKQFSNSAHSCPLSRPSPWLGAEQLQRRTQNCQSLARQASAPTPAHSTLLWVPCGGGLLMRRLASPDLLQDSHNILVLLAFSCSPMPSLNRSERKEVNSRYAYR